MTNETEKTTQELKKIKTKWSKDKIPACINNKNHKWKGAVESCICRVCGYDVLDNCYKEVEEQRGNLDKSRQED